MPTFAAPVRITVLALALSIAGLSAQTVVTPPKNSYSPAEDVEVGQQAAAEVEKQLPVLRDDQVSSYISTLGSRLVSAIPADLQHSEFRYSFHVVNVREINAFALPGGPMYVHRGMVEAAKTEGEVVGVMAHELAHVALRHGTAQATKATKYQLGGLLGAVVGSVIGGRVGSVVSQGTQFGLGTAFLRFSREFEREADVMGAQIMARGGYDPREMANMFKTIEKQGGSGGPQWLSDHPNPGDRFEYISAEARSLHVENPVGSTQDFSRTQSRLRSMPKAPTTEEATRNAAATGGPAPATTGRTSSRPVTDIAMPSSAYASYTEGDVFRVSVPSNWQEVPGNNVVAFVPDGASGDGGISHGMQMGISRNETHDLRTATDELVATLSQSNTNLRRPSSYQRTTINRRQGLRATISNGPEERITVYTAQLSDGNLFYALGIAPSDRFPAYETTFARVIDSIEFVR